MQLTQQLAKLPVLGRLCNGWPGPVLAKVTQLWKLWHVLRGTYRPAVAALHERSGPTIQVAPNEISVSDKSFVYIPKLQPTTNLVELVAYEALENALMSNIYCNEHLIDTCNHTFSKLLSSASDKGENVDIRALLTRYAYDVMLATTTGQPAGYLDDLPDTKKIDAALADWKFYSILYGSYLRYHPFIKSFLSLLGYRGKTYCDGLRTSTIEAQIALALSGADPTITLIFTAIQQIYANPILAERLRVEIENYKSSYATTFKDLILHMGHMPLLHAILLECARLQPPHAIGPQYTALEGVAVANRPVASGTLVSLEPATSHVNPKIYTTEPFSFKPERWLDPELAQEMKYNLLAFNASTSTPVEQFQLLVASKFLATLVSDFNLAANPTKPGYFYIINDDEKRIWDSESQVTAVNSSTSSSIDDSMSTKVQPNTTNVTLSSADRLNTILGTQTADDLLMTFAPHLAVFPKKHILTKPIHSRRDRALVHEAVQQIYGARLEHRSHWETNVMCIGPFGSIPRGYFGRPRSSEQRPRQQNDRPQHPHKPDILGHQRPSPSPAHSRPDRAVSGAWGQWANKEAGRVKHLHTPEGYAELRSQLAKDKGDDAPKQQTQYKTTFKQTNGFTRNGRLGGVRSIVATEVFSNEGTISREETRPPMCSKQGEQKQEAAPAPKPKPKVLPPHLRRKQEQERAINHESD